MGKETRYNIGRQVKHRDMLRHRAHKQCRGRKDLFEERTRRKFPGADACWPEYQGRTALWQTRRVFKAGGTAEANTQRGETVGFI